MAIAMQAEDDEHDTASAACWIVPAGSGGACICHVGVVTAAAFLAAGLAVAAGPVASALASPAAAAASATAAATSVSRPDAVRPILIIRPRMMSWCYLAASPLAVVRTGAPIVLDVPARLDIDLPAAGVRG
jgi:hypothetical protein